MKQTQLTKLFLDQSKDLFWIVNSDFQLIYANKSYLSFNKEVNGEDKKLNESIFTEGFSNGQAETWKAYYSRAFQGEHFEIEEHVYHPNTDQLQYTQIIFEPLTVEDGEIFSVAFQSKDITRVVKERSEENQLIDSSLDVFCTVNEQGNFIYVSAASFNHWGYSPEELIGKSYQDLILEEDLSKTNETIDSIHSGQGIKSFVNRYKKKDGSIAYNSWSARWDDRTKLRYAVARDGKEKIKQEEAILRSEQRYKALVQDGSDLIRILDAEGNFIYVSPTSASILGIPPEEFIGKNMFNYIHPDDLEKALECLQKINTEKKVIVAPVRFQNHKKEWRWMESVLTNMLDNPAVNGIVVNSRDITDKIEKEHQLKLLESVITNTNDAILITEAEPFDEPGPRIIYVNEAFTKMTGYEAGEVIGKSPRMLQGPNSDKEELSRLSTAIRNWESCEITTINYKKNGEEFWVNFTVTPVANEKGWYTHWIAIERDVTEQMTKELEKELIAQISLNFTTEDDLTLASNKLCRSIGELGKFDWVELWTTNLDKSQMQLFSHYVAAPEDEKFYDDSSEFMAYEKSEGLSGKVWSEGIQILLDDVGECKEFIRRDQAKKIGLKSVIGIPLISNDEVIGILHVGSKNDSSYLNNYARIFQKLEGYLGSMLDRKKLENNLTHLFEALPDILCLVDFQGKFLKINLAGSDLLGYSQEDILYHTMDEFAHPDDKEIFINQVMGLEETENRFKFENRYITKSGNIVWLSWYCNSTLKEGLIYATAKDITQEVKNQRLLKEASQMSRIGSWELDLVNQNEDSLYWSSMTKIILEAGNSYQPSLKDEIEFIKIENRELIRHSISNLINDGIEFDKEVLLTTKKGNKKWVRCIGKSEVTNNKCIKIYGSLQDINEQKLVTLELEKSLKKLEDYKFALDQAAIIAFTDKKGIITSVNDNFCKISKYTSEELIGKTHQLINSKNHPKEFFNSLWKTIKSGNVWRGEIKNKTKDGAYYWTNTTIIPFLDEKKIPFQYLAIRFDITSEKIAEEAKNSLQITLESSLNEIYIFEAETLRFSYVNKGALRNIGYSEHEIKALTPLDINPDYTASYFNQLIAPLVTNEKDKIVLFTNHKRKNGSIYPVEIHLQLVTEGSNKRFLAIVLDITDRKKAEENIRQSEEANRLIMNSSLDAIICMDVEGNVIFWNPPAEKIFGWLPNEVMGQKLSNYIIPEEFRSMHDSGMDNYLKTGEAKVFNKIIEISAINKNGEIFPVELTILPVKQGEEEFFCSFIRDITERKKAEESILQSKERFEKVTEATNDAIWDWDIEKQTYYRSKAVERFFGKDASGLFPENEIWTKEYFHPDDLDKIKCSFYEAIANPLCARWESEYRVINELGKTLYVIDRAVILRNPEGKVIRVVGAMTDISESKRMTLELSELNQSLEQHALELERSNEELEQFAFVASHDLQAPLRMVSSFMDLLERKYGHLLDEKGHQYIHYATDGAKRMKQIILDLLEYSKASGLTEGKEEVDFNELLADFKQLRRKIISETKATIKSSNLPVIYTYRVAIIQILHCLLDNALKYTEAGNPLMIKINAVENEKEWEFSIKDNGIGIEPQFHDKIFVLFQRLHNREQYEGTGIGLSIAKKHVEFLGGRIWLESELGKGTVFYFTIPKTN
jgi:PAS domain S-box-containing protein